MHARVLTLIVLLSVAVARADYIADAKTPELIEALVAKCYDTYLIQPSRLGDFQIGSAYTDRFHQEGLVRIVVSLPGGTQKSFDFDDRFSKTKPTKIESISSAASRLVFELDGSVVRITSTTYQSRHAPVTYQVWTIDIP